MHRHITPTLVMLTGEESNNERRTVDLLVMPDGRDAAVLRHLTPSHVAAWHITADPDPDAEDMAVTLFPDIYVANGPAIDWYMPREAVEAFIVTFIAAIH